MTTDETAQAASEIEAVTTTAVETEAEITTPAEGEEKTQEPEAQKAEGEAEAGNGEAEGDAHKKPNRTPAKERIAELTRQRREAEKRAEIAEAKLKAYEAPAPKRADYADDDSFEADRAKWAAKAARGDEAKQEADTAKSEAQQAKAETWNAQRAEIVERHPDFDQKISSVPGDIFNESVADAILESEMAADVAYVLANNLDRAKAFAAMTPIQRGREIGRIEAELAPKPRKISSAPPPVETIGTKGPGSGFNPHNASVADIAKHLGLKG